MPSLGNHEFPKANIETVIEASKKIATQFKGVPFDRVALCNALGYKGPRTGAFNQVLADLRRFGVIEGRGESILATGIAQRLAVPTSNKEYAGAVLEMMNQIPLFKQLFEHYRGVVPSPDDLLTTLINITKEDRVKVAALVPLIRSNLSSGWAFSPDAAQPSQLPHKPSEGANAGGSTNSFRDDNLSPQVAGSLGAPSIVLTAGAIRLEYPLSDAGIALAKALFATGEFWTVMESQLQRLQSRVSEPDPLTAVGTATLDEDAPRTHGARGRAPDRQ